MKTDLKAILNAKPALDKLLNSSLPISAAFKLKKLVRAINEELSHFENERISLVKKFGVEDDQGNINVDPAKLNDFSKELDELLSVPVELSFDPISYEKLQDISMSAVEMALLDDFVV
jgi:hypothetical protein